MREKEAAPVEGGGVVVGDEGMNSRLAHLTLPDATAATRCRLCGVVVGERDFPANFPFDSTCRCGSPFPPAPTFEELPAPNELWFREHADTLGPVVPSAVRSADGKSAGRCADFKKRPVATRARVVRLA